MASWQGAIKEKIDGWRTKRRRVNGRVEVDELRSVFNEGAKAFGNLPRNVAVAPVDMGTVRGEWVEIEGNRSSRIILYFHGGGYIAGSPETHRPLVAKLAKAADARVLSVDYRLAPEFQYPAAVRDALDAYRWLLAGRHQPGDIVLAGDCAGGGLALAALLAIRNADLPQPAAGVALSPWADLALAGWSLMDNRESDRMLNWEALAQCARHYLNGSNPTEAFASPVYGDFRGLPPLLIHAGSREVMRDDASRLGQRAAAAGVNINVEVYDGMPHVFQGLSFLPEARVSLNRCGAFIKQNTNGGGRRHRD